MPEKNPKIPYIVAMLIAISIAGVALLYKIYVIEAPTLTRVIPTVGTVGSAHAHASLLVIVKENILNFCAPQYMLRSQYVHFENNDCTTVHRHATGITIPTFFKTIGIELSSTCLIVSPSERYCTDKTNQLRVVVNGTEVPIADLQYYEFRNNDHILVDYGTDEGVMLKFKYNQVPAIPIDVNEPLVTDAFGASVSTQEKVAPLENTKVK